MKKLLLFDSTSIEIGFNEPNENIQRRLKELFDSRLISRCVRHRRQFYEVLTIAFLLHRRHFGVKVLNILLSHAQNWNSVSVRANSNELQYKYLQYLESFPWIIKFDCTDVCLEIKVFCLITSTLVSLQIDLFDATLDKLCELNWCGEARKNKWMKSCATWAPKMVTVSITPILPRTIETIKIYNCICKPERAWHWKRFFRSFKWFFFCVT